jgi:hypothetical protein
VSRERRRPFPAADPGADPCDAMLLRIEPRARLQGARRLLDAAFALGSPSRGAVTSAAGRGAQPEGRSEAEAQPSALTATAAHHVPRSAGRSAPHAPSAARATTSARANTNLDASRPADLPAPFAVGLSASNSAGASRADDHVRPPATQSPISFSGALFAVERAPLLAANLPPITALPTHHPTPISAALFATPGTSRSTSTPTTSTERKAPR